MSDAARLTSDWDACVAGLGADAASPLVRAWGQRFIEAYAEPHRRYHDQRHLLAVLARLESWRDRADDYPALLLTAFAHDAVYRARPGADERESAELALQCCAEFGVDQKRADTIAGWIGATAGQAPQTGNDGALFLDADLEILAAPAERYDAYAKGVREEFIAVPEPLFRAGRSQVLKSFLSREAIYRHPLTPPDWERRARENLAREIAALDKR